MAVNTNDLRQVLRDELRFPFLFFDYIYLINRRQQERQASA